MRLQHFLTIRIECTRIINRLTRRQRAKTSVEMVKPRIHQFHGQHEPANRLRDVLVRERIAANAVAGKKRRATEEGIARALKIRALWQVLDREAVAGKPLIEMRR